MRGIYATIPLLVYIDSLIHAHARLLMRLVYSRAVGFADVFFGKVIKCIIIIQEPWRIHRSMTRCVISGCEREHDWCIGGEG